MHSFPVFIVEQFLRFHQTLGSQSFLTNVSRSVVLHSSLLSWQNPWWLETLLSGSYWKLITLLSKFIFVSIKKNLRNLVVGNDEFLWLDWFPVIILAPLVCFHCCNSVSYDFHCLILCKQMSYIIIIMILTAIIHFYSQKIVGGSSWNSTFSFRSGLVNVHVYLICINYLSVAY